MNFLIDMLNDWPVGTIIGIVCIAVIFIIIGLIFWGLYIAVDSWFMPRKHRAGRIVNKLFTPAHTTIIYTMAGKTMVPQPIFHHDDWSITVEVGGQQDSISVSEEFYESHSINDTVMAEYVEGRFSKKFYIKSVGLI